MVLIMVTIYMFSIYATKINFTAAQRIRVEYNNDELVPEKVIGYAVVSTKKNNFF